MRLNLGCGQMQLDGWINVDANTGQVKHDLAIFPWPWLDGSIAALNASHLLEHFTRQDGERFLAECARVLAPGGMLTLAVPDMDIAIDCLLSGDPSPMGGYGWPSLDTLMGGGEREPEPLQRHRYLYSWASLAYTMAGDYAVFRREFDRMIDNPDYRAISLYVAGVRL